MVVEIVSIVTAIGSIIYNALGSKKKIKKKKKQLQTLYQRELGELQKYESELKEFVLEHKNLTLAEMRRENELAFEERKEFRKQLERL